jgi:hypothetical protein
MMNLTHRNGVTVGDDWTVTGWWRCALSVGKGFCELIVIPQQSPNNNFILFFIFFIKVNFILKCLKKKKNNFILKLQVATTKIKEKKFMLTSARVRTISINK